MEGERKEMKREIEVKRGGWRWKGRGGDARGEGRDGMKKRGGEIFSFLQL